MTRTSHALAADGNVWFVDPVDWPEALERASLLGRPTAVIQLIDRHNRDAKAIANRLGVSHLVVPPSLPGTPFEVVGVVRRRWWREVALWWPEQRTLVVAEALGSNRFFTVGEDDVGVHGLLRPAPPRAALGRFEPEHLLLGHGEGIHGPRGNARAATGARALPAVGRQVGARAAVAGEASDLASSRPRRHRVPRRVPVRA